MFYFYNNNIIIIIFYFYNNNNNIIIIMFYFWKSSLPKCANRSRTIDTHCVFPSVALGGYLILNKGWKAPSLRPQTGKHNKFYIIV